MCFIKRIEPESIRRSRCLPIAVLVLLLIPLGSAAFVNNPDNWYKFQASYERGFLDVLSHRIQFGTNGTEFDYVGEGGQDVLFPFSRLTAEINMKEKHNLIFLIQPFDIKTTSLLSRDIVVDERAAYTNSRLNRQALIFIPSRY